MVAGFGVLRFRLEFVCGGVELAVSFPSFRWVGFVVLVFLVVVGDIIDTFFSAWIVGFSFVSALA